MGCFNSLVSRRATRNGGVAYHICGTHDLNKILSWLTAVFFYLFLRMLLTGCYHSLMCRDAQH
jgi:hypothetical protein